MYAAGYGGSHTQAPLQSLSCLAHALQYQRHSPWNMHVAGYGGSHTQAPLQSLSCLTRLSKLEIGWYHVPMSAEPVTAMLRHLTNLKSLRCVRLRRPFLLVN